MTRPYAPGYRIPPELLLKAYASGVFPMAESATDPEVFWVRPETRGIIPLDGLHVPRSLAKTVRQARFEVRFDHDFEAVIDACAEAREERRSTWINAPIREAYVELYRRGHCHSVECWREQDRRHVRRTLHSPAPMRGAPTPPRPRAQALATRRVNHGLV